MRSELSKKTVCVVGLGYVGLPLALEFAKHLKVIGFDSNPIRVKELDKHRSEHFINTSDPKLIKEADFDIIAVPTPVTKFKDPDLLPVIKAAEFISQNIKPGCTIILESSVYPGVTEEVVVPILEKSGLRCGKEFKIGYSPERINPGDNEHGVDRITKVVSGMDADTTELVAELYSLVCPRVFKAKNIKTAEAAKVIENIQRDLNIALMNELSLIFERIGLNTNEVLDAAATKWNFARYSPGLVGGHCIPVDPYYLVYKARELGYHPQVILAGRAINDYMPVHIAQNTIKALNNQLKVIRGSKVLIMGLTYKENVPDIRETPSREIIKELKEYGVELFGYDPIISNIDKEFGIESVSDIKTLTGIDCVIITVMHDAFRHVSLTELKAIMSHDPVLVDVRGLYSRTEAENTGFHYLTL